MLRLLGMQNMFFQIYMGMISSILNHIARKNMIFHLFFKVVTLLFGFCLCRGLGTGEPIIGLNYGHLYGSLERVEAIITSTA
jgi:hypothetical protein